MKPKSWKWWRIDLGGALVCAGMTAAFYLACVGPVVQQHEAHAAQQAALDERRTEATQQEALVRAARARLETTRQSLADTLLTLLPAYKVNQRLGEVSTLASDCGLKIDEIQPGPATPGTFYDRVPISLAGSGSYPTCTRFLHQLRRTFPDTSVSSLELIAAAPPGSGSGTFRFNLQWHAAPAGGEPAP